MVGVRGFEPPRCAPSTVAKPFRACGQAVLPKRQAPGGFGFAKTPCRWRFLSPTLGPEVRDARDRRRQLYSCIKKDGKKPSFLWSPTCEYIRTVECCIYIGKSHNCVCVGIIAVDKQFIFVNKHRIQKCVNQSFPVGQFIYVQIAQTLKPKSYLILI